MLIGEPPRTQADVHFRLFGIPVRIHPFFWLSALILGMRLDSPQTLLIWVAVFLLSILVHELGHALVARVYGWDPWITLYSFGGLASYRPTYADPRKQILVTLAGPGAGFLLALLIVGFFAAIGNPITFSLSARRGIDWSFHAWNETLSGNEHLRNLVHFLLSVNIFWGLLNLIPVYPLDGGNIAREILTLRHPHQGLIRSMRMSMVVGGCVAIGALLWLGGDGFLIALMFGYFAYWNYTVLQNYQGSGGGYDRYRGDRW